MKTRSANILYCFLNFPFLSLFTVLFAYVVCFGCFVVKDLCRSGCGGNSANSRPFYPAPILPSPEGVFSSLPRIVCLTQVSDCYLKSVRQLA